MFFSPNKILQVYLNNNGLSMISKSLLDFKNAEVIQIEGNPINCNCEMVIFFGTKCMLTHV